MRGKKVRIRDCCKVAFRWPLTVTIHAYEIQLKIEGNAERTANGYKFICPIFRLDKSSLHQGLEKLSDKIRLSLAAVCLIGPCKNRSLYIQTDRILERPHKISFETSVLSHTLVIKRTWYWRQLLITYGHLVKIHCWMANVSSDIRKWSIQLFSALWANQSRSIVMKIKVCHFCYFKPQLLLRISEQVKAEKCAFLFTSRT